MKTSSKKGFTIVEIVIALVIISIASLTATSLVLASQQISKKTRDRFFATDLQDNSIAIFTSLTNVNGGYDQLVDVFVERMSGTLDLEINDIKRNENKTTITLGFDSNWKQADQNIKHKCTIILKANNKTLELYILVKASSITVECGYEIYAEGL